MAVVIAPRPRALQPIHRPVSSLIELVRLETTPQLQTPPPLFITLLKVPPGVQLSPGSSTDMWTWQLHPITFNNDLGDREMRGEEVIRLSVADRSAEQEAWEQAKGNSTCDHTGAAQPVLHYWLISALSISSSLSQDLKGRKFLLNLNILLQLDKNERRLMQDAGSESSDGSECPAGDVLRRPSFITKSWLIIRTWLFLTRLIDLLHLQFCVNMNNLEDSLITSQSVPPVIIAMNGSLPKAFATAVTWE
ncbi:hypothetical protein Q5P01_012936 [Channa striata]|uniref:Uncharacterized protein n=1 Tax=Channa striata TaxID=64152 RepID=A0AA88SKT1_CHASR|nr:hypothetical protein Q5P01_012936 [Channa striata]